MTSKITVSKWPKSKGKSYLFLSNEEIRESFRLWLIKATKGCGIQGGNVRGKKQDHGWPCRTCVIDVLERLGLNPKKKEYKEHNIQVDRLNEVWRAILQIRDAKLK